MTAKERILAIRVLDKLDSKPEYSRRLKIKVKKCESGSIHLGKMNRGRQ